VFSGNTVLSRASALAVAACLMFGQPRAGHADPSLPAPSPDAPAAPAPTPTPATARSEQPVPPPPAGFDGKQAIDESDYRRKTEGGYFTGLPLANYDSNTGVGLGVRGYYYFNGQRTDPLFAYTPYLYRVFLQGFATTGGLQFHWLDIDVPTIARTPFRFRSQLILQRNTDQHYFGIGSRAMQPLAFTGSARTYDTFSSYQTALDATDDTGQTPVLPCDRF
jgi:hypothetical protein